MDTTKNNQTGYCILVASDHASDFSYSTALKSVGVEIPVFTFDEGDHLINFLKENKKNSNAQTPLLIISSLNSEGSSTMTMLQRIKGHPDFSEIPFIVLSADQTIHDIRNYYHLGASSFLPKPQTAEEMEVIANGIKIFWIDGLV